MAYCKSCGAYIPDGLNTCLACGFDEGAEKAAAAAAAQKAAADKAAAEVAERRREEARAQNEDMRQVMERHRRLQQEKNRQWAEQEKERRDKQAENRQWAQEEYARRQAQREVEAEQRARAQQSRTQAGPSSQSGSADQQGRSSQGNTALAALSYISFFFAIPMIATPKDEFAMFHAKQGLRLFIFSFILDLIGNLFPIGWLLSLCRIYFIFKGISAVLAGKKEPLPYIGNIGNF